MIIEHLTGKYIEKFGDLICNRCFPSLISLLPVGIVGSGSAYPSYLGTCLGNAMDMLTHVDLLFVVVKKMKPLNYLGPLLSYQKYNIIISKKYSFIYYGKSQCLITMLLFISTESSESRWRYANLVY